MKTRIRIVLAMAMAVVSLAAPAAGIEPVELSDALNAYRLSQLQIAEYHQELMLTKLREANGPYDDLHDEFSWAVERWRPVVDMYFPEDRVDWALRIMECESHGNPDADNPNSSASGLFQHLARLWPPRATAAGWEDADVFDPFANIAVAAWLLETGGTSHWVCKARR